MAVMSDGTVFTDVEWEEGGGNVGEYRDGELVRYARHTHGWGAMGGEAIAVNPKYVFIGMAMGNEGGGLKDENTWPPKGSKWLGVSRRLRSDISKAATFAGGKGGKGDTLKESFLVVAEVPEKAPGHLPGLCANDNELFVVDPNASEIKVFDCESMKLVRQWKIARPGPIALDVNGSLWVLEKKTPEEPPGFRRFNGKGEMYPKRYLLRPESEPICFAWDNQRSVYVFDDSAAQRVRVYSFPAFGWAVANELRETGSFGVEGGIFAGRAGEFGDAKLNHVTALGLDGRGNIYLAQDGQTGGGGTVLESYALNTRKLNWRLFGLTFVDMADVDPASDTKVFTKEEHFTFDYTKPTGQEWRYVGYTVNRFKYPQDPRIHIWSAGAWVRQLGGKRILFVSDMNSEHLQVYRFAPETDGEIAIPSAFFAKRHASDKNDPTWLRNQPAKGEWLWRDKNGNGTFDDDEFSFKDGTDAPGSQGWWVDTAGNVWLATETKGIRLFPYQGLDAKGNPVWSYETMRTFPSPAEFKHVKRIRYLPEFDALFLAGMTDQHKNQHWKPGGPVLARYDGWLKGDRKLRWKTVVPYADGSQGHSSCEPMGFDVAGDFIFVPYTGASKPHGVKQGRVEIFRTGDGSSVGHVEPSEDVGEIGLQDIRECLVAHRRADGEFVVLLEDDYKSKIVAYRIKPGVLK